MATRCDILLAGVGGQGILTIAGIIDEAALKAGLHLKQSEVHGMAQRGGAVIAHLRISRDPIFSDLIPAGGADLLLAMEPLEALRQLPFLKPEGTLVANTLPVRNIPDYPEPETIYEALRRMGRCRLLDAGKLATASGNRRAMNVALLGAAAAEIPIPAEIFHEVIRRRFEGKGEAVVQANLAAFTAGRQAAAV